MPISEMRWFGQELFEQAEATTDREAYEKARANALKIAGPDTLDTLLADNNVQFLVAPTRGPSWHERPCKRRQFSTARSAFGSPSAIAGYPHLTVPMGAIEGLPVGLSIMGAKWDDHGVLEGRSGLRKGADSQAARAFVRTVERSGGNKSPRRRAGSLLAAYFLAAAFLAGAFLGAGFSQHLQQAGFLAGAFFAVRLGFGIISPSSPEPSWRAPSSRRCFSSAGAASASAFLAGAFFFAGAFFGRRCSLAGFLRLDRGLKLLDGHFAFGHFGLVEQEVDDFVFVQRRAQLGGGHRLGLDVFDETAGDPRGRLTAAPPAGSASTFPCPVTSNAVGLADFRQQQAQTHPALGNRLVLVLLVLDLLQRRGGIFLPARLPAGAVPRSVRTRLRPSSAGPRNRDRRPADRAALASSGVRVRPAVCCFQLGCHDFLELVEAVEAETLGEISSILVSVSTFTAFTVTSKVASLPARCSAWYSAGKVTVMVFF